MRGQRPFQILHPEEERCGDIHLPQTQQKSILENRQGGCARAGGARVALLPGVLPGAQLLQHTQQLQLFADAPVEILRGTTPRLKRPSSKLPLMWTDIYRPLV